MKSVLRKRFKRELTHEFGKYAVIFLFLAGVIGFVSGFLVSSDSMLKTYHEGKEKYQLEDGNFTLTNAAADTVLSAVEKENLKVYEKLYLRENTDDFTSHLRIYKNRTEGDLVCLMSGKMPAAVQEIALDRMYATYNKVKVGDIIKISGKELKVSGFVALPEYAALYENSSDMMFDATQFGVGIMTDEGFDSFGTAHLHYNYAYKYSDRPDSEKQEKELAEALLKVLVVECMKTGNAPTEFLPAYLNNAIQMPGEDMGKDSVFVEAFLYIVIATLAMIFAITISNTITKESMVIGTLRASGYTKKELIIHYMTLPMLVILTAAIIGNILGYTVFRKFGEAMYYGSYSLATYKVLFNAGAFIRTTIIPCLIMFTINLIILVQKLSLSPLRFLRRDIGMQKKKGVMKLSGKMSILARFRLRILFRNIPHYVTMFVGIFFANALILFGFALPAIVDSYKERITDNMICTYQYILKTPVETNDQDAEKFAAITLKTPQKDFNEEVTVLGIVDNTKYADDYENGKTMISSAYSKKYDVKKGDTIVLVEPYTEKEYSFIVDGVKNYPGAIALFLPIAEFNETFDYPEGYFNGLFSDIKLTDLPEQSILMTLTADDMTKTVRQLKNSLGELMSLLYIFGVVMFLLICFLLTKLIIEKDAQAISMTKILGYSDGEIGKLYILTTSIVVIFFLIITIPISNAVMVWAFKLLLKIYPGYLEFYVPFVTYIEIAALGIGSYFVILLTQLRKIKKIKKSDALKTAE